MSGTGYRLFQSSYKDRHGQKQLAPKWTMEFSDHRQTTRRITLFLDKKASEECAKNIVKLMQFHVATGGQIDPALMRWLSGLPVALKTKLAAIGLLPQEQCAAAKPLTDHIEDFRAFLVAKDNTENHVEQTVERVRRAMEGCRCRFLSEVSGSKIAGWLHEQQQDTEEQRGLVVHCS
jgi:hypothetical protein